MKLNRLVCFKLTRDRRCLLRYPTRRLALFGLLFIVGTGLIVLMSINSAVNVPRLNLTTSVSAKSVSKSRHPKAKIDQLPKPATKIDQLNKPATKIDQLNKPATKRVKGTRSPADKYVFAREEEAEQKFEWLYTKAEKSKTISEDSSAVLGFEPVLNTSRIHHSVFSSTPKTTKKAFPSMTDSSSGYNSAQSTNHSPILLIAGYLRTGSTFTASLFAQHPNTFYVFEPLHMLIEQVQKSHHLRYIDGTVRKFPDGVLPDNVKEESLQHWFHCVLSKVDRESLEDKFHFRYTKSMRPFVLCIRQRAARLNRGFHFAVNECLPPAVKKCSTADLRVFKTIRLRMPSVEKLMRLNPGLKVIHLVRDPRGMMNSRIRNGLLKKGKVMTVIRRFCSEMMEDIKVSKRLLNEGNKNLYAVRYEDIAYNPIQKAESLYKFVNMDMGSYVKSYIRQSTSLNLTDNCAYCTRRGNSTKTANKWRDKINPALVRTIDRYCGDVYKSLGYIQLQGSNIRNHSIPSMTLGSLHEMLLT